MSSTADDPAAPDGAELPLVLPVPPRHPQRIVYLGTPEMAVPPLRALHQAGHEVVLVVTRADKRRGRGASLVPSPVKAVAVELGLPVTHRLEDVLDIEADLGVVVAYGRIIKRPLLRHLPMVNIHFSLLPRWRGAAPVERAVLAGDAWTGVDLMVVEEGLDTGGIYAEAQLGIAPDETAEELRGRLVQAGTTLLIEALATGLGEPRPQSGETLYAQKLTADEYEIDWTRPAAELHNLVRLGGAWTTFRQKRLKVWRTSMPSAADPPVAAVDASVSADAGVSVRPAVDASADASHPPQPALLPGEVDGLRVGTGEGVLVLIEVQPEGKARQPADAWRNGSRPADRERFGA